MADFDYKPNSHKFREGQTDDGQSEKRVEKVVKGTVKTKKNEVRKLTDIFIAEDIHTVKSWFRDDVLIPTVKKAVYDIVTNGFDLLFFGGTGRRKKGSGDYVSYRSYSDRDRRDDRYRDREPRSRFEYDDLIFETRGDAEIAREKMEEVIDRYGVVTVADLYDMADRTAPYTSNKYGWTSVRNADIVRDRGGGYVIRLPRAMPID